MQEIAYVGADDLVYVAAVDGSRTREVTGFARELSSDERWLFRWPTFSPDGSALAFAGYREREHRLERATVVVADLRAETGSALRHSPEASPIYLYWAPDSQHLTVLMQRARQLELLLFDTVGPRAPTLLTHGNPLYWAWAPDGRTLAVHVGGDARTNPEAWHGFLHLHAGAVREERFADPPGGYRAPAWANDGDRLAYVGLVGGVPTLSVRDSAGAVTRLAHTSGELAFSWSPATGVLAFTASPSPGARVYQGIEVARADGMGRRSVTDESLAAFFWSPDGGKLAYVGADPSARGLAWAIAHSNGREPRHLDTFVPSDDFAFQLSFFDQYARSIRVWSPDSLHLVYAAKRGDERRNGSSVVDQIRVLNVEGEPRSKTLAPGKAAAWSPAAGESG